MAGAGSCAVPDEAYRGALLTAGEDRRFQQDSGLQHGASLRRAMIVVIMGVSGCGKTEVGSQLANKLGWKFYDADDYHPHNNKMKMGKGIPLNDQDRQPWLCKLHNLITSDEARGHDVVLACSALKKAYRETLATGTNLRTPDRQQQENLDPDIFFIHLQGSQKLISERIQKRTGHFMPVDLLASQFDTLEPPTAPEHFMTVNVEKDISQIVSEIQGVLEGKM